MRRRTWIVIAAGAAVIGALLLLRAVAVSPLLNRFPSSTAVFDENGRLLRLTLAADDKYRLRTRLEEISPLLVEAVLLQEDRAFYSHPGVNPRSLARAAWQTYVRRERRIGGSTITMQLARLVDGRVTRTPAGKIRQILTALRLEAFHSKREILEAYLNAAPYGGNVEGVEAASLIYFNKPASRLTLPEALSLAVIPQNPQRRITGGSENDALSRARMRLFDRWIERHPKDRADAALVAMPVALRDARQLPFLAPHFVDRIVAARNSGPRVKTTLDVRLQRIVERQLRAYVNERRRDGISNAAALLVDYRSMQVRAEVGSADFFDSSIQGQVNGTDAKRSPGSTLKPFLYALAIDEGVIHPMTVLRDSPVSYGGFNPENFDGQFIGPITAKEALIRSRNVPAVSVASKLGNPGFYALLRTAGISQLQPEQHYGLGLVLGGAEVTMDELAGLYASLANEGFLRPLRRTASAPDVLGTRILSPEAAFVTLDMMKDNPRPDRGVFEASEARPVCWKTGTSNGFRDAWSVGVFGPYVLAVWIGNFNGEGNHAFIGVEAAAPLFFRIVDSLEAHRHIPWGPLLRVPENLKRVDVCAVSGQLPGPHCGRRASTWFIPGKSPIKGCEVHREIVVDDRTGREACDPSAGPTHREVFEYWDSDMLRIFAQAGVPRRTPPPYDPNCGLTARAALGREPMITSPTAGVSYVVRAFREGDRSIPFRAVTDADAREVFWFVNEVYVGKAQSGHVYLWQATPGNYVVRAVDDRGRSGSRDLEVTVSR